jgi:hypothetical protein
MNDATTPTTSTPRKKRARTNDQAGSPEDRLIAKFPDFDPAWPADVQQSWFEAFEKIMALTKGNR